MNGSLEDSSLEMVTSDLSVVRVSAETNVEGTLPGAIDDGGDGDTKAKPQRQPHAHHHRQRNHSGKLSNCN